MYRHTETTLLEGQNWPVWWIGSKLGNHKKNWGPWDQTISLGTNELGQWEGDQWDEVSMRWKPVTWTFYYHLYLWESFMKITQSVQLNSSCQPLSWENCKGWRIKKCMNMQQIVLIYCISYHFQLPYISWCHLSLSVVFYTYIVLGKWTYSWYCPHTKSTKRWTVLSTVDLLTLKMSAMSRYIPPVAMNFKPICTCTNKARQY